MRRLVPDDRNQLRAEAEARFAEAPPVAGQVPPSAALLHELQVHQIELEMANEELRRHQLELEEAHVRQVDLYDFAPVGYVTLDEKGGIVSANLTAASLLGTERGTLLGRQFPGLVTREDGDRWHLAFVAVLQGGERAVHRLTFTRGDGTTFDGGVICERRSGRDGNQVHIVLTDVTEFGRMEQELRDAAPLLTSEERLRAFFQSTAVGIAITSAGKGIVEVNDCFCVMLGYPREDLSRKTWLELTHADDIGSDAQQFNRVLSGEIEGFSLDKRFIRKDGAVVWTLLSLSCVRRADRSVEYFVAILKDITDRKEAEAALRASEEHRRNLFDNLDAGIVVHAPDTSIVLSNVRAGILLGLTPDQMRGKVAIDPGWRFVREDGSAMPTPEYPVNQVVASGSPVVAQVIGVDRPLSGRTWALVNAYPEFDEARALRQVVVTFVDITSRKEAEQALQASEQRLKAFLDSAGDSIFVLDAATGRLVDCNPQACRELGYTRGEFLALSTSDIEAHLTPDQVAAAIRQAVAETTGFVTGTHRRKDGTTFPVEIRINSLAPAQPELLIAIVRNVSERKQAEERSRSILAAMGEGMVLQDASGKIVACNPAAERILGLSQDQMDGRTSTDPRWRTVHEDGTPFPGEDHPAMVTLRTGKSVSNVIMGIHKPDGTRPWISINAELLRHSATDPPYAVVTTFTDITKPRALQAQLALASRLAAMGTLVAGVAHEINNPLAAALADQEMALSVVKGLKDRIGSGDVLERAAEARRLGEVVEQLTDAQEGATRIERIVKELKIFARPDLSRELVNLADVVKKAMLWLPAAVGKGSTVRVEDGGAPVVQASFGQIEQVVVHLVTNAGKATKPGERGSIIIRVGPGSSGMARLEVVDQGRGIAPERLGRIFDPFFTTRDVGKGMGLGLAISHAIVTAHGGTLTVQSEVGKGSTFRVELPAAPAEA